MMLFSVMLLAQSSVPLWVEEDRGPYEEGARLGQEVTTLADLNGDGVREFAIGLAWQPARVYDGATQTILASLPPSPSWFSPSSSRIGHQIVDAGDLDGDGIADLVVAAPGASILDWKDYRGAVRAISGATFLPLWSSEGLVNDAHLGEVLRRVPDVNADGVDDFAASHDEGIHMLSGRDGQLIWSLQPNVGPLFATEMCGVRDLNGDQAGELLVYRTDTASAEIQIRSGADGTVWSTWRPSVATSWTRFGTRMAPAGDLNGDGLDEVVVQGIDPSGPRSVVVFDTGAQTSLLDFALPSDVRYSEMAVQSANPQMPIPSLCYYVDGRTTGLEFRSLVDGSTLGTYPVGAYIDGDVMLATDLDCWRDGSFEVLVGAPEYFTSEGDEGLVILMGPPAARLELSNLRAGGNGWARVSGLSQGERVVFFASPNGSGPTFASNAWFQLELPVRRLGPAIANAQGIARKDFSLPANSVGARLWFQAARVAGTTVTPTTMTSAVVE